MGGHHSQSLDESVLRIPSNNIWAKIPIIGLALGAVGLALTFVLGGDGAQAAHSYLVAFMWCLSFTLGGLFFVLIHYAARSSWSVGPRRIAESMAGTAPLMAILFIPIAALWMEDLFHWAHHGVTDPADSHYDAIIAAKESYLNVGAFMVRAVIYFAVWIGLSFFYGRLSVRQDTSGDEALTHKMQRLAPVGIIVFALTLTFAAFDWLMSLNPHWYSTIFGVYYFSTAVICGHALLAIIGHGLRKAGLLGEAINREHFHDFGKMMFAFTVFWAYIGFSQYMLIWYANLPEETAWFATRLDGSWRGLTMVLAVGHFVVPFFFLMSRHVKRRSAGLILGAV